MADSITYWHEFPSNFSGGQNVSSISTFMDYANYISNGSLGVVILISTFIISVGALKLFKVEKAMGAASFLTFIISLLLMRMGMLAMQWVFVTGFIMIALVLSLRNSAVRGL